MTFDEPPLNEVALGRTFLPRPDFLVPYFGAFWERIRDQLPSAAHAGPIIEQNETPFDESGVLLPRVWFLSSDSTKLLQLQQNRFHYNWRQTPENQTYVRFPTIQREALGLWEKFEQFILEVTKQPLQPVSNELTYTNFIPSEAGMNSFALAEVSLRDPVWSRHDRFLDAPTVFGHTYNFVVPNELGILQVSTGSAKKREGDVGLKLELTVRGKHSDAKPFKQWSSEAHDFLVAAFKDLTTPLMHGKWKLREDGNGK